MEVASAKFVRYQHQMTIVFVACFLLGAGGTFVHPWLPVIFVIVYFAIGLFATRNQKNSDRFADSLYYLGFLLTLVALLHATQQANASEAIIENLGTGLSTTLAGLAFRVLVIQFRETVSDQEEEAQVGVETEVQRLVVTFSQLTEGIKNFHEKFLGEANMLREAVTRATQYVDESARKMAELPGMLETALRPAANNLAAKISAVDIPADLIIVKADQAFGPLNHSVNTVANQFTAAGNTIVSELQRSASSVTEEIDGIKSQIAAAHTNLNVWIAEVATVPTIVRKTITESVTELRSKIKTINFDSFNAKQAALVSQLEATTNALRLAEGNTTSLDGAVSALGRSAEQIQNALAKAARSSEEMANAVLQLGNTGAVIQQLTNEIGELTRLSSDLRNTAKLANDSMVVAAQDLTGLRDDIAGVRSSTEALLEFAATELKR